MVFPSRCEIRAVAWIFISHATSAFRCRLEARFDSIPVMSILTLVGNNFSSRKSPARDLNPKPPNKDSLPSRTIGVSGALDWHNPEF